MPMVSSMSTRKNVLVFFGIALLSSTLMLASCSPTPGPSGASEIDVEEQAEAGEAGAWSPASDCGSCHVKEAGAADDQTTLYSVHAPDATAACINCHGDDLDALSAAHEEYTSEKARVPKKLKSTSIGCETCTSTGCHDVAALVEATEGSALADSQGKQVNPHSMMEDALHRVGGSTGADITCISCHEMHSPNSDDSGQLQNAAKNTCIGCHHADVFECGTCHD